MPARDEIGRWVLCATALRQIRCGASPVPGRLRPARPRRRENGAGWLCHRARPGSRKRRAENRRCVRQNFGVGIEPGLALAVAGVERDVQTGRPRARRASIASSRSSSPSPVTAETTLARSSAGRREAAPRAAPLSGADNRPCPHFDQPPMVMGVHLEFRQDLRHRRSPPRCPHGRCRAHEG